MNSNKLFRFYKRSVHSISSAHKKEPDWKGLTSLKRTNDSWQKDGIQFWRGSTGRRQRHKNHWSSSWLYHRLSMNVLFHWNYRALASQDSQQKLTTTTPPTLQPNTPHRWLTWWGQCGTTLRPPPPCSWQYFLYGLVIVQQLQLIVLLLLLTQLLQPQVEGVVW